MSNNTKRTRSVLSNGVVEQVLAEVQAGNAGFGNYVNYNNVSPGVLHDTSYVGSSVLALDSGFYGENAEDGNASPEQPAEQEPIEEVFSGYPSVGFTNWGKTGSREPIGLPYNFQSEVGDAMPASTVESIEEAQRILARIGAFLGEAEVGMIDQMYEPNNFSDNFSNSNGFLREQHREANATHPRTTKPRPTKATEGSTSTTNRVGAGAELTNNGDTYTMPDGTEIASGASNPDPDLAPEVMVRGKVLDEQLGSTAQRIKQFLAEAPEDAPAQPANTAKPAPAKAGAAKKLTPEESAKKRDALLQQYTEKTAKAGKKMSPAMEIFNALSSSAGFSAGESFAHWLGANGGLMGKALEMLLRSKPTDENEKEVQSTFWVGQKIYNGYHSAADFAKLTEMEQKKLVAYVEDKDVSDIVAISDKVQQEQDVIAGKTMSCLPCNIYLDGAHIPALAEVVKQVEQGDDAQVEPLLLPYVANSELATEPPPHGELLQLGHTPSVSAGAGGDGNAPLSGGELAVAAANELESPDPELATILVPLGIEAKGLTAEDVELLKRALPSPLPDEQLVQSIQQVQMMDGGVLVSFTDSNGTAIEDYYVPIADINKFKTPKELTDYIMKQLISAVKQGAKGSNAPRKNVTPESHEEISQGAGAEVLPNRRFSTAGKQVADAMTTAEALERRIASWLRG